MKSGSDSFRHSSILGVIESIRSKVVKVVMYEPTLSTDESEGMPTIADITEFKQWSDVIIANRLDDILSGAVEKVYTRDVFARD